MNPMEHPASQLLRACAYRGQRPPAAEMAAVVDDLCRSDLGPSTTSRATVERTLREAVEDVVAAHAEGAQAHARQIADETTGRLMEQLPDYFPPARDADLTPAEIVASIPRGIG